MRFGEMIQTYIKNNGMTYRQFSDICGMSPGYLSMLINNRNPKTGKPPIPSLSAYMNIGRAMGVTLDELFTIIDDSPISLSMEDDSLDIQPKLSPDEIELVCAYRAADERARSDAMATLLSHPANVGKNLA